jgi:hypothetical protein
MRNSDKTVDHTQNKTYGKKRVRHTIFCYDNERNLTELYPQKTKTKTGEKKPLILTCLG